MTASITSLSSDEIERIVRAVMERLAVGRELMSGVIEMGGAPEPGNSVEASSELQLSDPVIATRLIEGRLAGKQVVRVAARAVVTPAAKDLLRSKNIELRRDLLSGTNVSLPKASVSPVKVTDAATPASPVSSDKVPFLVCGSAVWFASLTRHLCPQQTRVKACTDSDALTAAKSHMASGGRRVVWISSTPFAATAAVQRSGQIVAVPLPSLTELSAAVEQAQPQILIVDANRWTVAAIGNLVRMLSRNP